MSRRVDVVLAAGPFAIAALLSFILISSVVDVAGDLAAYVPFMRFGESPLWLAVLVYGAFAATFAWIGVNILRGRRPPRTWGRSGDPRKR
ncbi:hypothetical protein ACFVTX_03630 [Agromyces sp. NPDC058136]|uniref:hypothetical protein n=1 Tax=Agromyces sp. NPDC058136 TaxID=3346354 RepID=UPI0036DE56B6